MSISGITPFHSAAVSPTHVNDAGGTAPLQRQLLTSVLLADHLGRQIAGVGEQAKQYRSSPDSMDQKLASFWQGKVVTFEEREPREQIQYEHDNDLGFLRSKGSKLEAEVEKMPAGPEKEATQQKLKSFLQTSSDRIELTYQQAMARETGLLPARDPFKKVKNPAIESDLPPIRTFQSKLTEIKGLTILLDDSISGR